MTTPTLPAALQATASGLAALTGRPPRIVAAAEALAALRAGAGGAIAVLPWDERRDGRRFATNQLVLRAVEGDRLRFANPLAPGQDAAPGAELGGPGQGPRRRREAGDEESMAIATFEQLVALGGRVVLPG